MNIDVTISIHALLAESDNAPAVLQRIFAISIHALLAESDQCRTRCAARSSVFLSTLSLRRATTQGFPALHHIFISIHALLAESDDNTASRIAAE